MIWWIIGAALVTVAALSIWFNPASFVAGLIRMAWDALAPALLKRKPPEEEAAWRKAKREGRGDVRDER